jgi:drug/metabolite transporter (DMT)-like permease
MVWLLLASLIWAFSFGIVKNLTISVDPFVVNLIRIGIATIFFIPWQLIHFRFATQKNRSPQPQTDQRALQLNYRRAFICGAIQLGLMYGPYTLSFRFIKAHEVALFTMTTPLIMAIFFIPSQLSRSKDGGLMYGIRLATAILLATAGGVAATYQDTVSDSLMIGAILVQLSNLFFALGSFYWTKWFTPSTENGAVLMTPFFAGALVASAILFALFSKKFELPNTQQFAQLLWLGAVSSGIGFFLWNKGAINVSGIILSIANNLKLPIAVLVSIVFFGEKTSVGPLVFGILLIVLALQLGSVHQETKVQH